MLACDLYAADQPPVVVGQRQAPQQSNAVDAIENFLDDLRDRLTPGAGAHRFEQKVKSTFSTVKQKLTPEEDGKLMTLMRDVKQKLTPAKLDAKAAPATAADSPVAAPATASAPVDEKSTGQKIGSFFSDIKQKLTPEEDGKLMGMVNSVKSKLQRKDDNDDNAAAAPASFSPKAAQGSPGAASTPKLQKSAAGAEPDRMDRAREKVGKVFGDIKQKLTPDEDNKMMSFFSSIKSKVKEAVNK
eukprot:TRINITY_DN2773_c0_g1_i1.p2 TRINITY_DN2773_c0_g1~~TRINITY_DN2773_c0_g1_i1.p2  ORF type:complete len:243 (-),score=72.30 TRINITY_DN2773_c0_g1_i1:1598-2326(-)